MGSVRTFSRARKTLGRLCDEAVSTREPIIIMRRGTEDVALVAADELRSLMETAHLLRSPANASGSLLPWTALVASADG